MEWRILPRETGREPRTELRGIPSFNTWTKEEPVKELRVWTKDTDMGVGWGGHYRPKDSGPMY